MNDAAGVAAPQINYNYRFFIMGQNYENDEISGYKHIINPKILRKGDEMGGNFEMCFSLPG